MIDYARFTFHPVIFMPAHFEIYDFTKGYDPNRQRVGEFGIGRYNEKRHGMYTTELFQGTRDIHVGIDIAAPVGTPVHAFFDGEIFLTGYNAAPGDYGATVITRHVFGADELYVLHGHLSRASLTAHKPGDPFKAGDVIAWIGDKNENGGWNPHLHFQLSYERPLVCDMPGAVSEADLEAALKTYPDPRLVLGPLY